MTDRLLIAYLVAKTVKEGWKLVFSYIGLEHSPASKKLRREAGPDLNNDKSKKGLRTLKRAGTGQSPQCAPAMSHLTFLFNII